MILTLDASLAVKCVFDEAGSADVRALVGHETVIAPDFLLLETHHVLWKRVRRKEMSLDALSAATSFLRASFDRLVPSDQLIESATQLSIALDHAVYDCLYIALARRENVPLATADTKQAAAAMRAGIKVHLL